MLANKFDGDCFALVGAHQHGITIHNHDLMRERESGVISFIIWGGGGKGELGNTKVSIVYSIRMGELGNTKVSIVYSIRMGGGGGGGNNYAWGRYIHCAPSPLLYIKPDKLIAVDNLNLRIDCLPLNNE